MLIYIVIMLLIIILQPLTRTKINFRNNITDGKNLYLFIILSIFAIVMGIRGVSVGVDTAPYTRIYDSILSYSSLPQALKYGMENAPVYVIMCRLIGIFFKDPQWLSVFTAIIINIGLYIYIKKRSSNYFLSLFTWVGLTLFFFSMNGNRQTLSMVIAMNGFSYLVDNIKSKKGWFLFILSIGIHTTSLFLVVGLLLIRFANLMKNKVGLIWYSVVSSVVLSFLLSKVVSLFSSHFSHYDIYSNGVSKYSILSGTGNGRILILYMFLLFICLLYYLKFRKNNELYNTKLLPALFFGVCFGILNCKNELITRMIFFYFGLFVSFMPEVVNVFKGRDKILVSMFIVVVLGTYAILSLLLNQNGVVPYTTFFA